MEILELNQKTDYPVVLALGYFDSVHLGHQKVFEETVRLAKKFGVTPAAFTFTGDVKGTPIQTENERLALFDSCGIDLTVTAEFNAEMKSMPGEEFFEILTCNFDVKALVCGFDYRFGANAECTADHLAEFCNKAGIALSVLPPVGIKEEKVSTSAVKTALSMGEPEVAAQLLGRIYTISGVVEGGYHLGQKLGFPTANISMNDRFLPKAGVYAVLATAEGKCYRGVANLGAAPTFLHDKVLLETHLDGYNGDLYGQTIEVGFVRYLRAIRKFPSKEALIEQLSRDVAAVREDEHPAFSVCEKGKE